MTRTRLTLALAASLIASIVEAQGTGPAATVTVLPAEPTKWDAAIYATWLGERRLGSSFDSDRWYGVASGGAQVGYHWTSHLKVELDVATSSQGESYSFEVIPVPGSPTPLYLQRSHDFRATTASAGLEYQFFENAWFHPLVGAGLELLRERERIETTSPAFSPRDPRATAISPQPETLVRYAARPFVGGGFKAYVSDHAFIRTDLRVPWSSDGVAGLAWRSGVGVDF